MIVTTYCIIHTANGAITMKCELSNNKS